MHLVIHAGTPKAASTSFQTWCVENRRSLRIAGIWYPTAGRRAIEIGRTFGHYSAGHTEFAHCVNVGRLEEAASHLREAISEAWVADCPFVLVSQESLIDSPEGLASVVSSVLSEEDALTLVLLRRPLEVQVPAIWRELLLDGVLAVLNDAAPALMELPSVRIDESVRRFLDETTPKIQPRVSVVTIRDRIPITQLARHILESCRIPCTAEFTDVHVFANSSSFRPPANLLLNVNQLGRALFGEQSGPPSWAALPTDHAVTHLPFVPAPWGQSLRAWANAHDALSAEPTDGTQTSGVLGSDLVTALTELEGLVMRQMRTIAEEGTLSVQDLDAPGESLAH
jgi:hypothetical protein